MTTSKNMKKAERIQYMIDEINSLSKDNTPQIILNAFEDSKKNLLAIQDYYRFLNPA